MYAELIEELGSFSNDPFGFMLYAFPWGEPGTELENAKGLEEWQAALCADIAEGLTTFHEAIAQAQSRSSVMSFARTSGHGIGKSAFVSMLILWAISTFEDTKGVVTANTETQLKTKTWAELSTWYRRFIGRDLFKMTATALFSVDPLHEKTWRIDMVPWSERNTEAFAGLHNLHKRILLIFDEASAIPDLIWEVSQGALTDKDTQIIWAVFGNPTKNTGRFRECFPGGRFAHRWKSDAIDSRTVSITNQAQINEWLEDYDEDSDYIRVRVRGVFPRIDMESFISYEAARVATKPDGFRPPEGITGVVVLGVDVARFGPDASVIYPRRGPDAYSRPPEIYYGIATTTLVGHIVNAMAKYNAVICMVDEGGVGGGVVDQLRQLRIPVIGVDFGSKPDGFNLNDGAKYKNKRAEIWGALRAWLPTGMIPDIKTGESTTLRDELVAPTYTMSDKEEIILEKKAHMKARKVASPNVADALALTFAAPHFEVPVWRSEAMVPEAATIAADHDPFAGMFNDTRH